MALILYTSTKNIKILLKERFGPSFEEEVTTSSGKNNSITPKFGLSKLLGLFVDASIEGNIALEEKNLKTIKHTNDFDDNLVNLIRQIEQSEYFKDVKEISLSDTTQVYKFNLSITTSGLYNKTETDEKMDKRFSSLGIDDVHQPKYITVIHESENLKLEGITSIENWGSGSLAGLILLDDRPIDAKGLLVPIKIKNSGKQIILTCQFLLIYK